MDKRLGAQMYTVRAHCKTLEDFDESCRKVREIGYKTVQLSGIADLPAEEIKKVLDKHGLEVVCTHRPFLNYFEHMEETIDYHKTIGCKICGLGGMPNYAARDDNIAIVAKVLGPICEQLKEAGLTFAYHNHAFEFEKKGDKYAWDVFLEKVESDNLKLILDVYWLAHAGINPAKFIRDYAGRIACVHLKDKKVVNGETKMCEVGKGNLDWDDILNACEEAGVEYALVEQDTCETDPFDCLKTSYDFLSKKGFE